MHGGYSPLPPTNSVIETIVKRRILFLVAIVSVVMLGRLLLYSADENVFLKCETIEDKVERYSCYKDAALYAMQNGKNAEELALFHASNSHLQQHAIGRAMLITLGYDLKKTAEKCMPCIGPYLHAISQEWGKYAPSKETEFVDFLKMKGACPLDGDAGCYHNLGHFYQGGNEDFGESVALCNKLKENERFYECAYGVAHERFIQTNGENFFQLCAKEVGRRKTACYTIGSRLLPQWLASRIDGAYPFKPCDEVSREIPAELNHCYAGAAWVFQNKGGALDPEQCSHLTAHLKELCRNGVSSPEPFWDII